MSLPRSQPIEIKRSLSSRETTINNPALEATTPHPLRDKAASSPIPLSSDTRRKRRSSGLMFFSGSPETRLLKDYDDDDFHFSKNPFEKKDLTEELGSPGFCHFELELGEEVGQQANHAQAGEKPQDQGRFVKPGF